MFAGMVVEAHKWHEHYGETAPTTTAAAVALPVVCSLVHERTHRQAIWKSHMVNETLAPFISRVCDAELN